MITPMEIHNREFKKGFRGYNENEVDEFLDRVVVDYEKVLRENEKLRDKLNLNDKEVENYKKLEKNLQETLSVAQKTADEVLESAKKSAQELKDNAARDSKSIYDNTIREAQNIREQAQLESKRLLDDAAHKLRIVVEDYEKIVREKNSFLLKIRTALESELAVTAQLLTSVPRVEELAALKTELSKIESANKSSAAKKNSDKKLSAEKNSYLDEEFFEKVSQVVSKPKTKPVEVEKKSDAKSTKITPSAEKISDASEKNIPDEENSELEDTKFLEEIPTAIGKEKISETEIDDLDKTMVFKPIKKSAD